MDISFGDYRHHPEEGIRKVYVVRRVSDNTYFQPDNYGKLTWGSFEDARLFNKPHHAVVCLRGKSTRMLTSGMLYPEYVETVKLELVEVHLVNMGAVISETVEI